MEKKERDSIERSDTSVAAHSIRPRRATVSCSTPPQRKANYGFKKETLKSRESAKSPLDLEEENQSSMTRNLRRDQRNISQPISIPRLQVSSVEHEFDSYHGSPSGSSVGDFVYNSPKLPRPSNDFNHVMVKLQHRNDIKRIQSCDDVVVPDSDGESRGSPYPLSSSLPPESIAMRRKGGRSVHFDEATITVTADLGESAARFRSLFRKKRGLATLSCQRFGESKTITVQHEEEEEVPSPQLDRKEKNKSIFDVCNYSAYGRYT